MALTLIQNKENENGVSPDNDAALYHLMSHSSNGRIFGFAIKNVSGDIVAEKGMLLLQGFCFEALEDTVLFSMSSATVTSSSYYYVYLVLSYDATKRDASFRFEYEVEGTTTKQDNVQQDVTGEYWYPIAKFMKLSGTITNFTSLVGNISLTNGSGTGIVVPTPRLTCIVVNTSGSTTNKMWKNGKLILSNGADYVSLSSSYTIKFLLMRKMASAHYRIGKHVYKKLTGWVKSDGPLSAYNPGTLWCPDYINFSLLTIDTYNLSNYYVISPISTYINSAFYQQIGSVKSALTATTLASNIRATRSKKLGQFKSYKSNFFEFAYKAVVYDSKGNVVGESGISNSIAIFPIGETKTVEAGGLSIKTN